MAGESPDSSKQRESSAEPTSGGKGPVPESRDPRAAMARGGVDTATRTLSLRDLPNPSPGSAPADATSVKTASQATDAETVPGDDPRTPEGTGGRTGPEPEAETQTETETAPDAGASSKAAPEAGPDADADAELENDAETENNSETENDAETEVEPAAKSTPASGPHSDRKAAPKGDLKTVTFTAPEADPQSAPEAESETEQAAAPKSEPEDEPKDDLKTVTLAAPAGEASTAPESAAKASRAPERAEEAPDAVGADDDTPEASGTPEAPEGAENREVAEGAEGTEGAEAPDGSGKASDGSRAAGGPGGRPRDRAGAPSWAKGGSAPDESAKSEEAPAESGKSPEGADGDKPDRAKAVDQPTAVFQAVRPAERRVDQPTTTLKVNGSAPASTTPDRTTPDRTTPTSPTPDRTAPEAPEAPEADGPAPEAPSERTGERTSRFVPLANPERTTQQPLPPKPPLDLLAELTNTPPPPPTPLRTLARRVKIWTPLIILLAVVFAAVQSLRPVPAPTLDLTAESTYTFEGDKPSIPWPAEGQGALDVQGIGTFGSSGEEKPVPIASVAKVMTAYLILRDHPLKSGEDGPEIKIDRLADEQSVAGDESTVPLTEGDSITQREALQAILIASANNVARLLARWDSGSEQVFVDKMNAAAKDLGMKNTTYTDPSGLNDTTVSTAVDQVRLAKAAMNRPVFREVAAMMEYRDYKGNRWPNWNRLVGRNGVVGIKTGTTTSARGNLVFAAKKEVGGETRTIVGAVLRQPAGGYDNTILSGALDAGDKLIRGAQDALESATILKKGDVVGYVDDGLGGRTPVVVTEDVTAAGWAGLEVELSFVADDLPHSAKAGTRVGTLTVGDGSTSGAVKVPVALQRDLAEPGFTDKLTRVG